MTPDVLAETIRTDLAAHDWSPATVRTERTWRPAKDLREFTGQDPLFSVMPFGVESHRESRSSVSRSVTIHVALRGRCVTEAATDQMCQLADAVDEYLADYSTTGVVLINASASPLWDADQLATNKLWFSVFVLTFLRR